MASSPSTVDYIVEQIQYAGQVHSRKMFGEYGIYCDGKMVALVCDDLLYVKPTAAGRAFVGECPEGCPYPGAKPCLLISGDRWEDREWMARLVQVSANELPVPKNKPNKVKKKPAP
jgi:TfoX/Sxy family transcriptional regulator of competence genes